MRRHHLRNNGTPGTIVGCADRAVDPSGRSITFSLMTVQHDAWTQAAEIIAEYLPKVGLQANVRTVGWDGVADALRAGRWEMWVFQDLMGYPYQWPDRMDAVRPSLNNAYPWMRWMETNGQAGEHPPVLMRECWRRWKLAQSASTPAELDEQIHWLQQTAAEQLWSVGINSFPPSLWVVAPNVRNVAIDQPAFLKSVVYVDEDEASVIGVMRRGGNDSSTTGSPK